MLGMLLCNGRNKSAIEVLISDVQNERDKDIYSIKMDGFVKGLGKICCFDSDLIYSFYEVDDKFINEIVRFIITGIE